MNKKILLIIIVLISSFLLYGNEEYKVNQNIKNSQYQFKNPIKNINPLIKSCRTGLQDDDQSQSGNNEDAQKYLSSSRGFLAMGIIGVILTVSAGGFLVIGGFIYLVVWLTSLVSGGVILTGIPFAVAGLTLLVSIPLTIIGFIAFAAFRKKYKRAKNGSRISYNEKRKQIEYDIYYSIKI